MARRVWRRSIAELRRRIWDRDGRACVYCRVELPLAGATLDHVQAVAAGGSNDEANLACCCAPCNRAKGTLDAALFRDGLLRGRGKAARRQIRSALRRRPRRPRRPKVRLAEGARISEAARRALAALAGAPRSA